MEDVLDDLTGDGEGERREGDADLDLIGELERPISPSSSLASS